MKALMLAAAMAVTGAAAEAANYRFELETGPWTYVGPVEQEEDWTLQYFYEDFDLGKPRQPKAYANFVVSLPSLKNVNFIAELYYPNPLVSSGGDLISGQICRHRSDACIGFFTNNEESVVRLKTDSNGNVLFAYIGLMESGGYTDLGSNGSLGSFGLSSNDANLFDANVTLSVTEVSTVPLPANIGLLIAGLLALGFVRKGSSFRLRCIAAKVAKFPMVISLALASVLGLSGAAAEAATFTGIYKGNTWREGPYYHGYYGEGPFRPGRFEFSFVAESDRPNVGNLKLGTGDLVSYDARLQFYDGDFEIIPRINYFKLKTDADGRVIDYQLESSFLSIRTRGSDGTPAAYSGYPEEAELQWTGRFYVGGPPAVVPLPAGLPLLLAALAPLSLLRRRRR